MTAINIDTIAYGGGMQVRAAIDEQVVIDYSEQMAAGTVFLPIVVFAIDGTDSYDLADGGHRIRAARHNGATTINAEVRQGTQLDALWYGLGANRTHGHRSTRDDVKHAVVLALRTWPEKSGNQIARQVGCDQAYVSRLKAQGMTSHTLPDRVTGKDGKSYPARRPAPQAREIEAVAGIDTGQHVTEAPATLDKSREGVTRRVEQMREMAAKGYSSRQMAAELGVEVGTCYRTVRQEGVKVPGDVGVKGARRFDPTRFIESTTMAADDDAALLQDMDSIDFGSVDREQLITCIGALRNNRRALGAVIRRLEFIVG